MPRAGELAIDGPKLQAIRERYRVEQREVARALGISEVRLGHIETAAHPIPNRPSFINKPMKVKDPEVYAENVKTFEEHRRVFYHARRQPEGPRRFARAYLEVIAEIVASMPPIDHLWATIRELDADVAEEEEMTHAAND